MFMISDLEIKLESRLSYILYFQNEVRMHFLC